MDPFSVAATSAPVDNSLLQGTKAPICQPDISSRQVYCLPGACICDVVEGLSTLVQPSDYYSLLLFHVRNNDTAGEDLERIKQDLAGARVKGMRAQMMFSLILLVRGKGLRRSGWIL